MEPAWRDNISMFDLLLGILTFGSEEYQEDRKYQCEETLFVRFSAMDELSAGYCHDVNGYLFKKILFAT